MRVEHSGSLNETVLYGMGDLHLRVMTERMSERYGVAVRTRPPSIPVSRDDHAPGGGTSPPQEADGRRRPVRRGVPQDRAARARHGLRIRRRRRRRLDPEPVHPGGREGHPPRAGRGRRRGFSAAGHPGLRLRRQVPLGRLEGSRLRVGRPQGLPRRRAEGRACGARADRARRNQCAGHRDGRHHGRPRDAPRPHRR